ncbi:MAG: nicotinate (nicotinamide) nucleotide adenylyltransferase [Planctomycetes bacterium]|nr:nicotinate (nicotinamide) nucleotide adenylyltransferase [Planctomycetota bacterium]
MTGERRGESIGILGGTFNPVHTCHIAIARACRERFDLDRVELVPCGIPPHKRVEGDARPEDRLAMVAIAAAGETGLVASDREVRRPGPSYTVDTLEEIRREAPRAEIVFIIGSDTIPELPSWYRVERILALARIATVRRPGHDGRFTAERFPFLSPEEIDARNGDIISIPPCPASASEIRRAIREGRPFESWVAEGVARYIRERGLYGAGPEPAKGRRT